MNLARIRTLKGCRSVILQPRPASLRGHIARIESKGRNVTIGIIDALARALGVEPLDLLAPLEEDS